MDDIPLLSPIYVVGSNFVQGLTTVRLTGAGVDEVADPVCVRWPRGGVATVSQGGLDSGTAARCQAAVSTHASSKYLELDSGVSRPDALVQRTSGDMRLNPHLHVVFIDGAYREDDTEQKHRYVMDLRALRFETWRRRHRRARPHRR
ncbi:hypothetical protein [Sorangium sp. So ce861]|uniref:hypothetical protein n=1 Tax=Sorangium sp. So ce861 TaxID=3133323 RepID=UPI003F5F307E